MFMNLQSSQHDSSQLRRDDHRIATFISLHKFLSFSCGRRKTSLHMRGASALLSLANKFKPIHPVARSWVATLTSNKQRNNGISKELMNEKVEPIVVFSKPPPNPPVIGLLVLFSLFEAWSSRDSDE